MFKIIHAHFSLLIATAILLLGSGLLGTLVALRAGAESFSQEIIGLIMSGFFMGYVLGSYLCPQIIRTVGHIRSFSVFAAMGSVTVILHGLIIDPVVWLILRIITGICMLGMYLVIESWINSAATQKSRSILFSIYMTVNLLALGFSQYLLVIYPIDSIAPFAFIALFFSLALVPISLTRINQPAQVESGQLGLTQLYATSPLSSFGAFLSGILTGAFWGMGPLYALSTGFDVAGITMFMSGVVFGGSLLQWPLGHLSDYYDRRLVIAAVSIAASIAAITVFYTIESFQWIGLIAAFVFGGCFFSIYSLSMAHANDNAEPTNALEISRGLLLLNGIGASIGPITAGLLMGWFGAQVLMFYFAFVTFLLASLALLRHRIGTPIPLSDQGDFVVMARSSSEMLELDPRTEIAEDINSSSINP
jgi:MFS family permease